MTFRITYAEISIQFAGMGEFEYKTSQGGQTSDNTVVVGQKVHAIVEYDPILTVTSYAWSVPTDVYVKHYITDDTQGTIVNHKSADYLASEFAFYYYTALTPLRDGSVYCDVGVSYVLNGQTKTADLYCGASYFIETPTGVTLTATQTGTELMKPLLPPNTFAYGENQMRMLDSTSKSQGMTFQASITAPTINGTGEVNFVQTLIEQTERSGTGVTPQEMSSDKAHVLDRNFPYGSLKFNKPSVAGGWDIHTWPISAGDTLNSTSSNNPLKTTDSPGRGLVFQPGNGNQYNTYKVDNTFTMYLMYKPNGTDSIWVPLQQLTWTWKATANWNSSTAEWVISNPNASTCGLSTIVTVLPTWSMNGNTILNAGYKDIQ